ncbi:hypothetical protein [Sulfurospirillum barnesii]|uniref:Uncharacterized protein n=1 Tax=Sulfurospirillum barnesii (strain ATCC 700032 / DSM 10660 / SES-3) TaxID=760154 RepID=I3XX49_SULBS|nr:hypothetical protein [Sulfurospirillum barnesii]AFL68523.1 hypothetical protein Sulba_1229 [Sulfurospirillum barnesii SES-3]
MKTIGIKSILCLLIVNVLYSNDLVSLNNDKKVYDTLFDKIAEKRLGANAIMIDSLENPFVVMTKPLEGEDTNASIHEPAYILEATLNQKAKIDGTWYKKNDFVGLFELSDVSSNRVILKNGIEQKELLLRTKDAHNIQIFSK